MKAQLLIHNLIAYADDAIAHVMVWRVPAPVEPSAHDYKYRLAYVVDGVCVLRFDNERGKGDHKHVGEVDADYIFTTLDALLDDFQAEIARWNDGHDLV